MTTHEHWMKRCLELAAAAKANGKTAVGALLVRNRELLADGMEGSEGYPGAVAHAEIVAILKAIDLTGSKNLGDCILYTTVEPCFMCSFLIRETRISRLVFGTGAGQIGGTNPEFPLLATGNISRWPAPVEIVAGVLEEECAAMLRRTS